MLIGRKSTEDITIVIMINFTRIVHLFSSIVLFSLRDIVGQVDAIWDRASVTAINVHDRDKYVAEIVTWCGDGGGVGGSVCVCVLA